MEIYFKELISREASLEKLVDDMALVMQGADEYARAAGATAHGELKNQMDTRLQRLREGCRQLRARAGATARATDRAVHQYPYAFMGAAFLVGVVFGRRSKRGPARNPRG